MTREQLANMTEDEKRIKVAELCGWKKLYYLDAPTEVRHMIDPDGVQHCWDEILQVIPDYLNDLNAMHEAEKILKHEAREFDRILWHVVMRSPLGDGWIINAPHIHATAAQRAEAFILTMEPK